MSYLQRSGPRLNIETVFYQIWGFPCWGWDGRETVRLVFNIGIPILVRRYLYIETPPPLQNLGVDGYSHHIIHNTADTMTYPSLNLTQLVEAEWRINASVNRTITDSDNGLSPVVFATKPLSEAMLAYCWPDTQEQISVKFESKYNNFYTRKWFWKCRLKIGSHFASA